MSHRSSRALTTFATLLVSALALTACGAGGTAADGGRTDGASVDTARVSEILQPYVGQASEFPVDEDLTTRPEGATIAYLQCATPFCAIFADLLQPAAEQLGATLSITKADASASGLQRAAETIISQKPSAVIIAGTDPAGIKNQLATLDQEGIPVLSNGAIGGADYGIDVSFNDTAAMQIVGSVLAAWAVDKRGGSTDAVFYNIPELAFSAPMKDAFTSTVSELCAACTVRVEDISVTSIGSTAPQEVVSDLQANPDTNVAVFASEEAATGLPAALRVAGLDSQVLVNGFGATPAQLEEISKGDLAASMAVDVPVIMWTLVDAAARLITGQEITAGEKAGVPPLELVDAAALEGKDISNGYSAYPDFSERFAALWGSAAK
ncbi:sugar ABC transporter substrate-binding protein [Microbacterium sp. NPDC091313]